MTRRVLPLFVSITLILVAAASVAAATECTTAEKTGGGDTCCFTNPRFTGVCQVTPGADETCSDILAYLNNQASVGKTYCGNTKVRGGWAQVSCDSSASANQVEAQSSTRP